jgi:hypothetical protein
MNVSDPAETVQNLDRLIKKPGCVYIDNKCIDARKFEFTKEVPLKDRTLALLTALEWAKIEIEKGIAECIDKRQRELKGPLHN